MIVRMSASYYGYESDEFASDEEYVSEDEEQAEAASSVPEHVETPSQRPMYLKDGMIYNPLDPFYYSDFVQWMMNNANPIHVEFNKLEQKWSVVMSDKQAVSLFTDILRNAARVCLVMMVGGHKRYIYKASESEPFREDSSQPDVNFVGYYTKEDPKTKEIKEVYRKLTFSDLVDEHLYFFNSREFIPYSVEPGSHFVPSKKINIFPGFKAKYVKGVRQFIEDGVTIPEGCDRAIAHKLRSCVLRLLEHIRKVWAKNNEEYYSYILEYFAATIRDLIRAEICLVIIGTPGAGKSVIFDFMGRFVYGPNLQLTYDSLADGFNSSFDGERAGKMRIHFDEATEVGRNGESSITKAQWNTLKRQITGDTTIIHPKGLPKYTVENYITYSMCSNYENPVKLDPGDRRYAIFRSSDEFLGNKAYFDSIFHECFNQEVGDWFYSYIRELPKGRVNIRDIPETEARAKAMETSKSFVESWISDYFEPDGENNQAFGAFYLDSFEFLNHKSGKRLFIAGAHLYEIYRKAHRADGGYSKPWSNINFGKKFTMLEATSVKIRGKACRGYFIPDALLDIITIGNNMKPHFASSGEEIIDATAHEFGAYVRAYLGHPKSKPDDIRSLLACNNQQTEYQTITAKALLNMYTGSS